MYDISLDDAQLKAAGEEYDAMCRRFTLSDAEKLILARKILERWWTAGVLPPAPVACKASVQPSARPM